MPRNYAREASLFAMCYKHVRSMPTVALSRSAWHLVSELRSTPCIAP